MFSLSYEEIIEDEKFCMELDETERKTLCQLLLERLRMDFPSLNIPKNGKIISLRPGKWQKEAGAFSWEVKGRWIGGCDTVKNTLNAENLSILDCKNGHIEILI